MPNKEKKSIFSKGTILSIILHVVVIGFLLFWGVTNTTDEGIGPLEVSLSTGDFGPGGPGEVKGPGGGEESEEKETVEKNPPEKEKPVEKAEKKDLTPEKNEEIKKEPVEKKPPEKVVEKQEEKETEKVPVKKKEPEKKEIEKAEKIPVEEKEEVKKEIVKEEKEVIPEKKPDKKEVAKKESQEREEPAEEKVIQKEKPESVAKKQEEEQPVQDPPDQAESDSSRQNVLKDIKRKSVLRDLKNRSVKTSKQVATRDEGGGSSGEEESGGGGGSGGTSSKINPVVLSTYYKVLSRRVERVLAFPPSIELDGSYTTFVRFWMNSSGKVTNVAVDKPSGNNIVDNYCVKAVNSAAPFPSPPVEIQGRIKSEPFVIPCKNES